jgi:hypothetical protein
MADRQTIGGYVKIATVASVDLPLIAQASPGNQVRFQAIGLKEAQELYKKKKSRLLYGLKSSAFLRYLVFPSKKAARMRDKGDEHRWLDTDFVFLGYRLKVTNSAEGEPISFLYFCGREYLFTNSFGVRMGIFS